MKTHFFSLLFWVLIPVQILQAQDSIQWNFKATPQGDSLLFTVTARLPQGLIVYANNGPDLPSTVVEWDTALSKMVTAGALFASEARQKKDESLGGVTVQYFENNARMMVPIHLNGTPAYLKGKLLYMGFNGKEFLGPEPVAFYLTRSASGEYTGGLFELKAGKKPLVIPNLQLNAPLNACGVTQHKESGILTIFLLGFLGGLIALLTPCVFPMIPLTVSFFTKRAHQQPAKAWKGATLYGLFIFLIYVSFSIPFHLIGNVSPTIYNDISTNVYLNFSFFVLFIIFAISFFGYFEITIPAFIANRVGAKEGGSSWVGILFMSLTLAIVSFSCTGPILGTLLVGTVSEGAWPLTAGLAGFGLALGLPFALFALFPKWLHSIPRSGGWLNTVKVVLGFVELALALKFFSNADLVVHGGWLKRELFFALWILIGTGLFVYLSGWIRFPHDAFQQKIGWPRRVLSLLVLAFTLYLVPGVTNTRAANLSLISGFPPPHCYSLYQRPVNCEEPIKNYFEAVKRAQQLNKPLLLDFTGWACVNCRKMEENVWTQTGVRKEMENYVLVSLYVDDKTELPPNEQYLYTTEEGLPKKIITVGDQWGTFQLENFNVSSQPWYVLLAPNGQLLAPPVGYTPNAVEYESWLRCGYEAFKKSGTNKQ